MQEQENNIDNMNYHALSYNLLSTQGTFTISILIILIYAKLTCADFWKWHEGQESTIYKSW